MNKEKIINMNTKENEKIKVIKRRANVIKEIAVESSLETLSDVRSYQLAAGIGLYQGLKYRGSIKLGFKAGLASLVVFTGANVIVNIVNSIDVIKDA